MSIYVRNRRNISRIKFKYLSGFYLTEKVQINPSRVTDATRVALIKKSHWEKHQDSMNFFLLIDILQIQVWKYKNTFFLLAFDINIYSIQRKFYLNINSILKNSKNLLVSKNVVTPPLRHFTEEKNFFYVK